MNELIFLLQTICIGAASLGALALGKSALVAFVCAQCLLANLFVLKQTTLFGLNATCADAFTIGATLGLNLLQEYYGRAITRTTVWTNFFILVFYGIISQIHLLYTPSAADTMQPHFEQLLNVMPRIIVASFSVYLIAQAIDYLLYGWLKKQLNDKWLLVRNYGSILASQLVDTILFTFLGLYGIIENPWHIIAVSYSIKVVAIALVIPFVGLSKLIKK